MPNSILHNLDESDYIASHLVFRQASNQQEKMIEWFAKNALTLATHDPLNVLSIGSGTGMLDKQLIPLFQQVVSQIHFVGIDPNKQECQSFEENTKLLHNKNVRISVHTTTLEDYETEQHFDLTLMVHVIYYFPDPNIPILTSYNLLKSPHGKGVIIVSPDTAVNFFYKEALQSRGYQLCLSPTVESILSERKIPYEKHSLPAQLEVTDCFVQGSEVGEKLLSFILQFYPRRMQVSHKRRVVDYLASVSYIKNGKRYIPHPTDIYILNAGMKRNVSTNPHGCG